jgi:serine/threonine protein kinase
MDFENGDVLEFELGNNTRLVFPKTFGNFTYQRTLGQGTFSAVVLCTNRSGKSYAVKVFSRRHLVEQQLFDRFEREVRVMESLKHPNIVALEQVVFTEEFIYLVMEYCERGELYEFLGNYGVMSLPFVARAFKQITEAICFIHSRDVVHRDLKPENILLDRDMNARLADFGLCQTNANRRLLETPCGSPFYASPEVLAQRPYDGKLADIWSLGVVLYTMVTGQLPWHTDNITRMYSEIQGSEVDIPEFIEEPIRELLTRMLSRNPANRPTAAEVLQSRWVTSFAADVPEPTAKLPPLKRASTDLNKKLESRWKKVLDVRPGEPQEGILSSRISGPPVLRTLVRRGPATAGIVKSPIRTPPMIPKMPQRLC